MTSLGIHDLKAAFRLFRSHPVFASSVVVTVAAASGFLGVATNLAAALLAPYIGRDTSSISVVDIARATLGASRNEEPMAAIQPVAAVLLLAAGMVLIGACANLAMLSMSHYRTRLSEFAIRASIGGTPGRLVRQLYAEGVLLSLGACALGGIFAFWTRQLMFAWLSPEQAAIVEYGISASGAVATSGIALAASALVFLACARSASGLGLPLLHAESNSLASAVKGARPGSRLVIVQVAVASASLLGATMLRHSLNHALQVGPGTTSNHVAVIHAIAPTRYEDPVRGRRFQNRALDEVAKIPGVLSADWTSSLPLVRTPRSGYAADEAGPFLPYDTIMVSSGYFATMQHPIVEGREFNEQNDATIADQVVINMSLAQTLFPDGALRRHLVTEGGKRLDIIGLVSDARYRKMAEPVRPTVFVPMSTMYLSGLNLVARTSVDASASIGAITNVLNSIDRVEIDRETTLDSHLETAVRRDRVALIFIAACASMILLLAVSGPYLLTRHSVTSRTDEWAVRLALGARGKHLFHAVLAQAATATATGVLIGEAIALVLMAMLGSELNDTVASTTLWALAIAVVLSTACAMSAVLPAFKIFRVSPAAALR